MLAAKLGQAPRPVRGSKLYEFHGLAGCVVRRRSRATKTLVGVYHGLQAGLDVDTANPWVTVCEVHGSIVTQGTLALALGCTDPRCFCSDCFDSTKEEAHG